MAKTKQATKAAGAFPPKGGMKWRKHGAIQKKKHPKYKNTPEGRINLINGSKPQNNNNNNMKQQKHVQKGTNASPQKSPKQNGAPKGSPQVKNNNKKAQIQQTQHANQKKIIKELVPKDEESDSDEDYNEGIVPQEEMSMATDDDIDYEEESDDDGDDVPDIFGTSLTEDSDDSDVDFDAEDSNNEEIELSPQKNKGVKMFTGVKAKSKGLDSNTTAESTDLNSSASTKSGLITNDDDDDDDEEEEEEDEDDDEDDDDDDDDHDDEDLDDEEESMDDEEIGDEDDDEDEDEDGEDEDEDEEDDDEDDDEEETGLGLKDLLGNSIVDDDDDEDFEGEEDDEDDEDDDISDDDDDEAINNRNKTGKLQIPDSPASPESAESPESPSLEHIPKQNPRTIFVGNLPVHVKKEQLKKLFKQYGPVVAVRLRGIVPIQENMPKKEAATTRKIHPKLKSIYAYVTFQTEAAAKSALVANGQLYEGHYLRVDSTVKTQEDAPDPKRCVFLGNLSFRADNNSVWDHFKDCGEIESVRIVRHNKTGVGKGIGYVNFKSPDAVALALELDGTSILNRPIRVKTYTRGKPNKKPRHEGNKRSLPSSLHGPSKKFKSSTSPKNPKNTGQKTESAQDSPASPTSPHAKGGFHGQKADLKKKKRPGKLEKQKRIMAEKLTAKTKKPTN